MRLVSCSESRLKELSKLNLSLRKEVDARAAAATKAQTQMSDERRIALREKEGTEEMARREIEEMRFAMEASSEAQREEMHRWSVQVSELQVPLC